MFRPFDKTLQLCTALISIFWNRSGSDTRAASALAASLCRTLLLPALALTTTNLAAQPANTSPVAQDNPTPTTTVPTVPGENRGWEGLAQMLDALTPSINTEETPSGTQITTEIETLINEGKAQAALDMIESREAELASATAPGTDVQLMFQKARALNALKRTEEAQSIYQEMTVRFPELAEPWNNLAMIYIQHGSLDEAAFALETSIMNNPGNGNAIANLADVRLLMAIRDYKQAAQMRVPGAAKRLQALETFLKSE